MRTCWVVLALVLLATLGSPVARGDQTVAIGPDKKLIEWGWDEPGPAFMRAHADFMDRVGFDGVIFHLEPVHDGTTVNFSWECWGATRFELADFRQNIEDLRACRFRDLTDNFARFNVCPGNVDWFDDAAFATVVHNAKVAAKVARDGGCKGFMFDIEQYNEPPFSYEKLAHKDTKTFAEYEQIVRRRGREFMQAINTEFPDIVVLLTYGYGITGIGGDRSKAHYGLLKNLLDGMFEAASPDTTIVDAYEGAYPFRRLAQFREAYRSVREGMLQHTAVPEAYARHVRVGFGVWMDMNWRRYGWHTDDFERNYFTPDEFEYSLSCGLAVTDKYVWVYTETPRWWTRDKLPVEYRRALRRAKLPRVLDDAAFPDRRIKGDPGSPPPRAADQPGYSDEDTFGDLRAKYDFLADLPVAWQFRTDPKNEGVKAGWFAPDLDTAAWRDIEIGKFWDEQGLEYTGYAWYRLTWDTPRFQAPPGSQVVLWFGAADEAATVWVNGARAGEHDVGADAGWDKRFPIVVTGKLRPGERNVIALRVHNSTLAGGLWKSVKLAVSKS